MKRLLLIVLSTFAVAAIGLALWSRFPEQTASAETQNESGGGEVSQRAADELQSKIDAVQEAAETPERQITERVEVMETELESYVLFSLKEHIPARMDSFDVQLGEGTVAADTQLTFTSNGTGNPLVDALMGGTHNLYVRGKFAAAERVGRFQLEEVRVDGIPVPNILIETLIAKYVKPKYPEVDINAPFEMPWGIDSVTINPGKATVVY